MAGSQFRGETDRVSESNCKGIFVELSRSEECRQEKRKGERQGNALIKRGRVLATERVRRTRGGAK